MLQMCFLNEINYVSLVVQSNFGDIEDKLVADLGVGCGVLAIGAVMLGAKSVVGMLKKMSK